MKNKNEQTLKPLRLFNRNKKDYIDTYGQKREIHSNYIYYDWDTGEHKLNMFGFYQLLIKNLDMTGMINHGYDESMVRFNFSNELAEKVRFFKLTQKLNTELVEFLNSVIDKPLLKIEQQILKEKVSKAGVVGKSYSKINKSFDESGYKFKIITKRSREYGNEQPTAWIVTEVKNGVCKF